MNSKTKALLGAFVALLVIVLAVRHWPTAGEGPGLHIDGFAPGQKMDKIEVSAPIDVIEVAMDGQKVVLSRKGEAWLMDPPKGAVADRYKVQQILEMFKDDVDSALSSQLSANDLKAFGLDDANKVAVTLKKGGADFAAVEIGAVQKVEGSQGQGDTFIRKVGEDTAYRIIDKDLRRPFKEKTAGMRSKKIFAVEVKDIVEITIERTAAVDPVDSRIVITGQQEPAPTGASDSADGSATKIVWSMTSPEGLKVADLDRYVSALVALYVQEFASELPTGVSFDGGVVVTITLADKSVKTVKMSPATESGAWLGVDGVEGFAKVSKYSADQVARTTWDLRDKRLFELTSDRIVALKRMAEGKAFEVKRAENSFVSPTHTDMNIDKALVDTLFTDIVNMKASDVVPPSRLQGVQTGLESPVLQIEIEGRDGYLAKLAIGSEAEKGKSYARVTGRAETFLVPSWQIAKLSKPSDDFRNHALLAFDISEIAEITLKHPDQTLVLVPAGGKDGASSWKAVKPIDSVLDDNKVRTLAITLAGLSVKDFVTDKTRSELARANTELEVQVKLNDGTAHRLTITGERKDNHPYAFTTTEKEFVGKVFTLNQYQVKNIRLHLEELQ